MQVTGPEPVVFGASAPTVSVGSISIDPASAQVSVVYQNPTNPGQSRIARVALTAAQLSAVRGIVAAAVQAAEGWASAPTVT